MACNTQPEVNLYKQYDALIRKDLANKQMELEILREIYAAQQNRDEDAFEFFLEEYFTIERLELTDEQKKHPEYKEWITSEVIKSGDFIDKSYDYE